MCKPEASGPASLGLGQVGAMGWGKGKEKGKEEEATEVEKEKGGHAWAPSLGGGDVFAAAALHCPQHHWDSMAVSRGVVFDTVPFSFAVLLVARVRDPASPGALQEASL